jgi:aspartate dehydrogenase
MRAVGIIGVGALGRIIADALAAGSIPDVQLIAIAARASSQPRLGDLARRWHCRASTDPLELPALGAALVVEAAGVEAATAYTCDLLSSGADVLMMSTGALADPAFLADVRAAARAAGRRLYLPSGAIAGLDGLMAAMEAGIDQACITTSKHPSALANAPYLSGTSIRLDRLTGPTVLFDGNAREAIAGFPSNINVAVTLATVVDDLDKLRVRIVADPAATSTTHKVEVRARCGSMTVELNNVPLPANPRTSWLAALSAVATIRRLASPISLG